VDHFPVYGVKLRAINDVRIVIELLCLLLLHPEFEPFSFVRGELVFSQINTNWLEGELFSWCLWIWNSFPNCLLGVIVHLAVELGMTREAAILDAVVLMCLCMGEYSCEQEVVAIDHDVLEDVRVAALSWDSVWWQIYHLV
jgi:hypothetical protein